MIKVMAVLTRKAGTTREHFEQEWAVTHPPLVAKLPGLRRYLQHPAVSHKDKRWPHDGIAELYFDTMKDVAVAFSSDAAGLIFAHEDEFLESMEWFLVDTDQIREPLA